MDAAVRDSPIPWIPVVATTRSNRTVDRSPRGDNLLELLKNQRVLPHRNRDVSKWFRRNQGYLTRVLDALLTDEINGVALVGLYRRTFSKHGLGSVGQSPSPPKPSLI